MCVKKDFKRENWILMDEWELLVGEEMLLVF